MSIEEKIKKIAGLRKEMEQAEADLNGTTIAELDNGAVAIGVFQFNNVWSVARLSFDPITGVGRVEQVWPTDDKSSAAERFKIEAGGWLPCFAENT